MILANIGVPALLSLQLFDANTSKFPRAYVRNSSGLLLGTINLVHIADGLYNSSTTFATTGYFTVSFKVFTDGTYTVEDLLYCVTLDQYLVEDKASEAANIADQVWLENLTPYVIGTAGYDLHNMSITSTPALIADAVWDEFIAGHTIPGSFGERLGSLSIKSIVNGVWDELVANHTLNGTYGLYIDVIRQFALDNNEELLHPVHGLERLLAVIGNETLQLDASVANVQTAVNLIIPHVSSVASTINANIDSVDLSVAALGTQHTSDKNQIITEVNQNELKIDAVQSAMGSIQNNTSVRLVVPDRLVKPVLGTKDYQFHIRLYDSIGNPEAPDSAPTIRIRSLASGLDLVLNVATTQDGIKVGAYYYVYSVSAGSPTIPLLVEFTVVEGGVAKYYPAVTEISEFEADLDAIQAQLASVDVKISDAQNKINNPVFGLSALHTDHNTQDAAIANIDSDIALVKNKTDLIPTNTATQTDIASVIAAVLTRSDMLLINNALNLLRDQIRGPGNRTNTDVYDQFDLTGVMQTNDPRLNNLDATISSRSTLTAPQVWSHASRTLTSIVLPDSELKKVWDVLITSVTTPNSMGRRVIDFLDVAVSTRATALQVSTMLAGVAQESTVSAGNANVLNTLAGVIIQLSNLAGTVSLVKNKTDLIIATPATQAALSGYVANILSAISSINLLTSMVKAKTDNLPVNPASQTAVLSIPTNPLRDNDARLSRLDVNVSSRSTLGVPDLAPIAKTVDVNSARNDINTNVDQAETDILAALTLKPNATALAPLAKTADLLAAEAAIIDAIEDVSVVVPPGLTAAQVWSHGTRTLTSYPTPVIDFTPVLDAIDNKNSYENLFSTAFKNGTNEQEIIVWAEKNGVTVASGNCTVVVKNSSGSTVWSAFASAPNADGVYKFVNALSVSADNNFYVIITTVVESIARESKRSFFTVG